MRVVFRHRERGHPRPDPTAELLRLNLRCGDFMPREGGCVCIDLTRDQIKKLVLAGIETLVADRIITRQGLRPQVTVDATMPDSGILEALGLFEDMGGVDDHC